MVDHGRFRIDELNEIFDILLVSRSRLRWCEKEDEKRENCYNEGGIKFKLFGSA